MASGIGRSNMEQLLSFLDITNYKLLNGRFFRKIELSIGPTLRNITKDSMEEAIEDEVRLTLNNDNEYITYKKDNLHFGIIFSFDMGWDKRCSGNRYDSFSEHALMIGYLSKAIVAAIVSSKMCRMFSSPEENGDEPPDHVRPKNCDGSSKTMEVDTALHLYKSVYELLNKLYT